MKPKTSTLRLIYPQWQGGIVSILAIVWIDAHPHVTLPYNDYKGYHAMALTACLLIREFLK